MGGSWPGIEYGYMNPKIFKEGSTNNRYIVVGGELKDLGGYGQVKLPF